ncbi:hypothetical protein TUM20983_08060 [Mycobacterium antarcticum]|nr:hypothetical protein TUM20983_08060 [Mycolicibacterium sp. TUM20983]
MPNSFCARRTAIHNRRSATIFASGDQMATISALAYRLARTFGIGTVLLTNAQPTERTRANEAQ